MEIHEAANLFPLDEQTIPELAEDIRCRGLVEAVKLLDGKVIDGRRRLRACEMACVKPRFESVTTDDPIGLSWSLNGPRRELTKSQKAMVGARMRAMYDRKAKERQQASGGDRRSGKAKSVPAILPEPIRSAGDARDQVGKVVGVSGKMIDFATTVLTKGVPEVAAAVEDGRLALSTTAGITCLSEEDQRAEASKKQRGRQRKQQKPAEEAAPEDAPAKGVGMHWANEAINCLIRIPKDDQQRKYARKFVKDWIEAHM